MAKIVIGIGTSHSPQLSVRANEWRLLREKDEHDPRLDYQSLLRLVRPGIENELTPEKMQGRDRACQQAIQTLGEALQKANADVVVVFGDDQQEQFHDDNMPTFAIYHGKTLPVVKHHTSKAAAWKA